MTGSERFPVLATAVAAARARASVRPMLACGVSLCCLIVSADVFAQQPQPAAPATSPAPAAKAIAKKKAPAASEDGEASAAKPKKDPAAAQRAIDAGIQAYQGGKTEQAVQSLSAGLQGGNLPPSMMGRALYFRGLAYRKSSKPTQAIADFTSALWLKGGLNDAERSDALQQRAGAYRDAGLPDQTDDAGKVAGAGRAKTAEAAAAPPPAPAPKAASGGGLFAGLFGGASASTPKPEAAPPPAAAAQPTPAVTAQPFTTRTRPAALPPSAAPAPAATAPAPLPAPAAVKPVVSPVAGKTASAVGAQPGPAVAAQRLADGKYGARVALAKTKQEAEAIAKRVRAEFANALGARAPMIGETTFGAMGTFYQVRVGPYASMAEAADTCKQIKGPGLDCIAVDR